MDGESVVILLDQRFFSRSQCNPTQLHAFSILSVVMELTDNVQLILNAVISSTVVEVQGEKLRRRNDWFHWLMPPLAQNSSISSSQSQKKPILVENLRRVAFDDKAIRHENADGHLSRSSSTELSTPSKQHGDGMTGLAGVQHSQPMPVGNPN
ncbi:hypothetical protein CQW23_03536 [Capsicum baccatum]|uniref:Uncharacterized protein n=1 Tax=Capsicum baccatum TaxID=33114 RepID=A0A2G2XC45_CAPBA|nr:hypothetical protein CQW23_03536 [Capsicum baccatum]